MIPGSRRATARAALRTATALAALALAGPAAAQTPGGAYDLDRDIADYEDTLNKIRNQRWVYLLTTDAGALISPDQEAGLFSHMILAGYMHPDSVVPQHRRMREATRILEGEIDGILKDLYRQRDERDRGGPPPPPPPPAPTEPDRIRATISGNWHVPCVVDGEAWDDSGTFTLTLAGDGSISGNYTSGSGGFGVGGSVDPGGRAQGTGRHPQGAFTWMATIWVVDGLPSMRNGTVHFSPDSRDVSCGAGSLTPTGAAVVP